MAQETNTIKIGIKVFGGEELKKLGATFGKINKTLVLNKKSLNETVNSILRVDKRAKSFNGEMAISNKIIREQIASFKVLRDQVDKGGRAYSRFSSEIDKLNAKLSIQPGTQYASPIGPMPDTRGRFGKFRDRILGSGKNMGVGQRAALGAIAGSGAAGSLGAVGSFGLSGGAVGGPMGAAIGVGIGATVEGISYAADAASYAAEIEKLRIALRGVTKDQQTYQKGLQIISTTSRRLNVPIAASTKQFTQLSASVLGAGGSIEQAEVVFTGVSNAIKATGGNAEDVQSAIRAMSQIFGKGKVSAEELQGQLGERLAGAVVKFAEANGSSLQKLQKDLRDGTVGLEKVIKFAEKLNEDFEKTANEIANSTADAGAKLKQRTEDLKLAIGKGMQPIGAAFQKSFADIADAIAKSEGAIKGITLTFATLAATVFTVIEGFRFLSRLLIDNFKIMDKLRQLDIKGAMQVQKDFFKDTAAQAKLNAKSFAEMFGWDPFGLTDKDKDKFKPKSPIPGLAGLGEDDKGPIKQFAASAFNVAKQVEETFVKAFKGMEDALVKFVMTGKLNFSDLARSIISDLTRMLVRAAIVKPLFSWMFPKLSLATKDAKGNVYGANGIQKFARGGIVDRPTLFPFKDGTGLMGEAGPEAIMPLKRGADGKLGVQSSGGVGNIVVNVDASGSSVEGDGEASKQFGRALASAIQSEMIRQKRPGGLLT